MTDQRYSTNGGGISFGPNSIATGKGGSVNITGVASDSGKSPNAAPTPADKRSHLKLAELERQYSLARLGLIKGGFAPGAALVGGLATLGAALFAYVKRGPGFLTGNQLVILYGLLVAGLLIYFSFVFRRLLRLRVELTKTKAQIDMTSGGGIEH
jgi:hypothetical protein